MESFNAIEKGTDMYLEKEYSLLGRQHKDKLVIRNYKVAHPYAQLEYIEEIYANGRYKKNSKVFKMTINIEYLQIAIGILTTAKIKKLYTDKEK